jgi:DNA-binding response OmpR family regulator
VATHSQSRAASRTVLVVDDDASLLALIRILLTSSGYEVLAASDGRRALDLAEQAPVDLVLLDLEMPVMDGRQFFHEFRSRGKTAPVIVVSAHDAEAASSEIGADGAVAKPFDPASLTSLVGEMLDSRG